MNDAIVCYHQDLSVDQQVALRTAAVRLAREFDGTFPSTRYENWDLDDPAA
jgi:hypothetical protein